MDKIPNLLPFYDGLVAGVGNAVTNAISQLGGNAECVAALGMVQVTHVGAAVSLISGKIFSSYLYYKFIVVPGSIALGLAEIDCTAYINSQKASFITGTAIFIFEGLPQKITEIITAEDEEPCEADVDPFGIGGGIYGC